MSASLIGHLGSSAFRPSAAAVSMSLTGSCFSSESAPRPLYGAFIVKEFARQQIFCPSSLFLFDLKDGFLARTALRPGRRAVKVGRCTNLAACSAFSRPYLDGFEGNGTLTRSGQRSEGSPLSGAGQSRHSLVSGRSTDPNHDAVMHRPGFKPGPLVGVEHALGGFVEPPSSLVSAP